jgi:GNAT superfamily N-acetyltransferase
MTQTTSCASADPTTLIGGSEPRVPDRHASLAIWVRQPWMVRVGTANVLIRGTSPRDFGAVAAMHSRCSARSLLDRYRTGGRPPSAVGIERALRRTLAFVACTARGEVIAMAVAAEDPTHGSSAAEVGLLVEDEWQRRGVGRELITHLAGASFVCGYTELIAYTGPSVLPAQALLTDVGRTYAVLDQRSPHLHTYLTETTTLGLGAIREHLAC